MMLVALCVPFHFSTPCNTLLAMLVYATHWLSMHLYTLAHMSMHKSCWLCRPCFNIMKLWTSNPNLHFSPVDTTFCLLFHLFAFLIVCLLSSSFAYHAYPLYSFSYALCIFSFYCLFASFLFLPLHVHTWSEDAWS